MYLKNFTAKEEIKTILIASSGTMLSMKVGNRNPKTTQTTTKNTLWSTTKKMRTEMKKWTSLSINITLGGKRKRVLSWQLMQERRRKRVWEELRTKGRRRVKKSKVGKSRKSLSVRRKLTSSKLLKERKSWRNSRRRNLSEVMTRSLWKRRKKS